jgi:spermidine/putrescine-binding protein
MLALGLLLALAAQAAAAPASSSSVPSPLNTTATDLSYLTAAGFTSEAWIKAFEKAKGIVSQMTLAEKMCVFFIPSF